jgi:hypothetical protein
MDGWRARGYGLGAVLGVLAVLVACNGDGSGAPQCYCPAAVGVATVALCGAIESATADPDGACNVQQTSGSLEVQSGVAGTCHVEVTFATGAMASTDITFAPGPWMACGDDPHGCGQGIAASPTLATLGSCDEAGAPEDAGAD